MTPTGNPTSPKVVLVAVLLLSCRGDVAPIESDAPGDTDAGDTDANDTDSADPIPDHLGSLARIVADGESWALGVTLCAHAGGLAIGTDGDVGEV